MADEQHGAEQRRRESLLKGDTYESPALTEIGSFEEMTAGKDPDGLLDDLNRRRF